MDGLFTLLKIIAVLCIAMPLLSYFLLRRFAAFAKLGWVPRAFIATLLGWLAVPLLLAGAGEVRERAGQAWLRTNCGTWPALWVGVPKPVIAPLPRFLRTLADRDKAAIINSLTTVEPRWPAIDVNSPELDTPRTTLIVMNDQAPTTTESASTPPERLSLVVLSHDQTRPWFVYGAFEQSYSIDNGHRIQTLATQRIPMGVQVLGATYLCSKNNADPPGTDTAIIKMIRAVLRPR